MLRVIVLLLLVLSTHARMPDLSKYEKDAEIIHRRWRAMGDVFVFFYYSDGRRVSVAYHGGDDYRIIESKIEPSSVKRLVDSAKEIGFYEHTWTLHSLIPDVGGGDYFKVASAKDFVKQDTSGEVIHGDVELMENIMELSFGKRR